MVKRSVISKPQSRLPVKPGKTPKQIRLYTQLLDHAHVMIRDPAGTINFWSRGLERLYGFTSAEAVGGISHQLLNTEFPCPQKDIDAELFETGEWNGRLAQRKRDGATILVASHWILRCDGDNEPQVTELKVIQRVPTRVNRGFTRALNERAFIVLVRPGLER